jgi:hypothetical protein
VCIVRGTNGFSLNGACGEGLDCLLAAAAAARCFISSVLGYALLGAGGCDGALSFPATPICSLKPVARKSLKINLDKNVLLSYRKVPFFVVVIVKLAAELVEL